MFGFAKKNKFLLKGFIGLFVFMEFFGMFFFITPVNTAGLPVAVTADVPAAVESGFAKVKRSLTTAALGSLLHATSYFMRRLAYDSATWIASGGKGQGALAFRDGAGAYFSKLALDASADMINEIGKPFGLNLCSTPDLQLQVFLQIGLHSLYWGEAGGAASGPQPSCNWQKMSKAWSAEAFEEKYGPGGSKLLSETFSNALRFEDSDFGIALGAKAKIDRHRAGVVAGGVVDRTEGQGFKPLTTLIGGKIIDPSQVVKEETKVISSNVQGQMTASQVAGIYGSGFLEVIPMTAQVFLNTLISEGMKTAQRKLLGLFDDDESADKKAFDALNYESSGFQSSRKKAESVFSSLLIINIVQINNYLQLEEFSSCPGYPIRPGLNNCVIDSGLRQALEESRLGEPLTIADALKKRYLHGGWPLYSPMRIADTLDRNCYQRGYCYPNIQKLRRARILPLGFEIAVELADADSPQDRWTLQKVVDGFYDCLRDEKGEIIEDLVNHPYCHLIDPNWILKEPEARCNADVYSVNLLDDNQTGARSQECVDAQSCIKEKENGTCEFFGYCTREKNVWRFNADKCESQYNTCTTYVSSENVINSYLSRTLDYGNCSIDSVGCRAYSTEKNSDGWLFSSSTPKVNLEILGRNQSVFFNQNIENYTNNCSFDVVGCTEFYQAYKSEDSGDEYYSTGEGDSIYLQKAPDYLSCYDINNPFADCEAEKLKLLAICHSAPITSLDCPTIGELSFKNCVAVITEQDQINYAEIQYPQTKIDLLALANRPEVCNNYAQVCLPNEVGCDSYTPLAGPSRVSIPGIIGENYCDASCVNYETFRQGNTSFEPGVFPLYFIPDEATQCNKINDGCDEFTNIDELSRGGESLEYYSSIKYCERPTGSNEKIFYSWEGSQSEGYVLKLHKLRPIDQAEFSYISSHDDLILSESINEVFPVGSPAYAFDSALSLQSNYDNCNQTGYYNLLNPDSDTTPDQQALADCRALYDKSGQIYYRLLADIITISDKCHPLRKTDSNLYVDNVITSSSTCSNKGGLWGDVPDDDSGTDFCQRCYAGGFYENGHCIYWAMSGPNESTTCPSTANGCREYSGNSANNLEEVFALSFDVDSKEADAINKAKANWYPNNQVSISAESIQVGLESLKVTGDKVYYEFDSGKFAIGDTFELSFWARGESQELEIYFAQDGLAEPDYLTFNKFTGGNAFVGIGSEWRHYLVGPVSLSDITSTTIKLVFEREIPNNNPIYFLDNLQLNRVSDKYYRIKNSWKKAYDTLGVLTDVPLICDDDPDDIYPGLALGCRQYEEFSTKRTDIYATGFDTMCREKAIGCQALSDTNNTAQINTIIYNLWCEDGVKGGVDKKCELLFDPDGVGESESVTLGSCIVPTGEDGCFVFGPINENGNYYISVTSSISIITNAVIKVSTVIIPGDSEEPVFLTNRSEFRCTDRNKGCQEIALEEKVTPNAQDNSKGGYKFIETFVLNNPEHYSQTLCRADLVGCEEFTAGGEISYFKDPNFTGSSFCEYKDKVEINTIPYKGWFLRDFGTCESTNDLCKTSSDCDKDISCVNQGVVPCYKNYVLPGGEYGLWSNNTIGYKGMVGLCPSDKAGCREIIDPQDTSALYPSGYPYYLIFNNKLENLTGECEGQASLAEGCVLFNKTDEPNLFYDSAATYLESRRKNFALVSLISSSTPLINDANRLLKVTPDRECAEWLSCKGYREAKDTLTGMGVKKICQALMGCIDGNEWGCAQGITKDTHDVAGNRLSLKTYISRDVDWQKQRDFSGYSLFNQYQIFDLDFFFTTSTKEIKNTSDIVVVGHEIKDGNSYCKEDKNKGKPCPSVNSNKGICFESKCVAPAKANVVGSEMTTSSFNKQECRGYPEKDSPFLDINESIVKEWISGRPFFKDNVFVGSNVCEQGEICDCDYLRIGYGKSGQVAEERFYNKKPTNTSTIKLGLCLGGSLDGGCCVVGNQICLPKGGVCNKPQTKNERRGWKGYCLQRDYSIRINGRTDFFDDAYACLTWLPLDKVPNVFDIFSANPDDVAYTPSGTSGKYYCTEMMGVNDLTFQQYDQTNRSNVNIPCNLTGVLDIFKDNISCLEYEATLSDSFRKSFFNNSCIGDFAALCKDLRINYISPINIYRNTMTFKDVQDYVWSFINILQNASDYHTAGILPTVDVNGGLAVAYSDRVKIDDIKEEDVYFSTNYQNVLYMPMTSNFSNEIDNRMVIDIKVNPGKNYLARVDVGAYSDEGVFGFGGIANHDGDNGKNRWFSEVENKTSINLKDMIENTAHVPIVKNMATQGWNNLSYAPLFPDVNYPEWVNSMVGVGSDSDHVIKLIKNPLMTNDSGVILHRPTLAESMLNQNFIEFVSIIPLWPSEYNKEEEELSGNPPKWKSKHDDAEVDEVPEWGFTMNIPVQNEFYDAMKEFNSDDDEFNKAFREFEFVDGEGKYYKQSIQGQKTDSEKEHSNTAFKNFGRYWTFKKDYDSFNYFGKIKQVTGYTLVWMRIDKFAENVNADLSEGFNSLSLNKYNSVTFLSNAGSCSRPNKSKNYFIAVEVLFDTSTGEFLGYKSRNCNAMDSEHDQWGFATAVSFRLKPICLETVEVYTDERENKAQTNNLWRDSMFKDLSGSPTKKLFNGFPFGSMIGVDSLESITSRQQTVVNDNDGVNDSAGVPLTCRIYNNKTSGLGSTNPLMFSGLCNRVGAGNITGEFQPGYFPVSGVPGANNDIRFDHDKEFADNLHSRRLFPSKPSRSYDYFKEGQPYLLLPQDKGWTFDKNDIDNYFSGDLTERILYEKKRDLIYQLFVKVYGMTRWSSGSWNKVTHPSDLHELERGALLVTEKTPPTILYPFAGDDRYNYFSYTPDCANPGKGKGNCNFDNYKNKFKVENPFSPDEFVFAKGYLTARLSFFAWADDNQMPLRNIKVDWGDGNIFGENEKGYYKNTKPSCGATNGAVAALKLNSSGKEFGLCSPRDITKFCGVTYNAENKEIPGILPDSFRDVSGCECYISDNGQLFGNQLGKTCDEEPYAFVWNYSCEISQEQKDDYNLNRSELTNYLKNINFIKVKDIQTGGLPNNLSVTNLSCGVGSSVPKGPTCLSAWHVFLTKDRGMSPDSFVCVYQPRVQAQDNWDWCTGNQYDGYVGCKDNSSAWVKYDNILVVSP